MSGSDIAFTIMALACLAVCQRGCSYQHDFDMKKLDYDCVEATK